ncbi:hypothetical protein K493DRAFT_339176 [Basidiobolus meristosporus CBS 931.73]|uniref:E3 ubiquitin-protein ligase n=1 Tax=Basidiobolus meristosporus CBS 931.73 TaxID=1314790 RepID=A0A1Y1Y1B9_9FUNG|nr:hypothetical protein K493DRAFT_339176 [Basidiobolus meristosporus CBS 931.73]|eukprot:ORX91768.1 hypothetical protein K493DRAFT_339176 [Basidiobolus meristosporus CBS 931.73]
MESSACSKLSHDLSLSQYLRQASHLHNYILTPAAQSELLSAFLTSLCANNNEYQEALFPDKDDLFLSDYCENDNKYSESHRGKPCGHIFRKGEAIYWCRTCGVDDTCVLCARCFQATDHQDHDTNFSINSGSGGCCDCGDFEAWKVPLHCAYHSPDYESSDDKSSTESELDTNPSIPEDLLVAMRKTIATVLDFILETCLLSPTRWHSQDFSAEGIRREASTSGQYISEEEVEQTTYACVLWNDETHNFDQVIEQIQKATGYSTKEATRIANKANSHGRAIVVISTDIDHLINVASSLSSIDLHVTIRSGRDTFREEVTGMLIDWLKELCSARRGEITSAYHGKVSDSLIQIVGDELGNSWEKKPENIKEILGVSTFVSQEILRFDQLLLYDACLWKEAKVTLREFYVSLFANAPELKKFIAARFAVVYTKLCENFLIYDQELEESIMLFTVQIFTVPTLSAMLVREYSFITTVLTILRSYFLRGEILPEIEIDTMGALVNCESLAMSSRKYFHIFDDFRYLTCSENVKSIVPHQPLFLSQYIDFISIFQGMNPTKRYIDQHVEFETEVAENAMNATLYLAELNRHFAGCYGHDGKTLGDAILRIVTQISSWVTFPRPRDSAYSPPSFKSERGITILDFQVDSQSVSFHHPLHWFLGHLLENVQCLKEETLAKYSWTSLFDLVKSGIPAEIASGEDTKDLLLIFDHPIRVCALLAQIRAGIWVRNGFEIKDQAEQYLDPSLRENTFDLDLLIVQTAFSLLPPDQVILTIVDRYALLDWFNGNSSSTLYDKPQLSVMVEELLYLFITCITERLIITETSMKERVMREIIHGCVKPIAYSELTERISERLTEYKAFDEILKQVTNFRPPDGVSDHGLYELKPEYYDRIDPYFIHYTRQDRDEAEEVLKKRTSDNNNNVYVSALLSLDDGPYAGLGRVIESPLFYEMITRSLHYALQIGEGSITIVDEALHLLTIVVSSKTSKSEKIFVDCSVSELEISNGPEVEKASLIELLIQCSKLKKFSELHRKAKFILQALEHSGQEAVTQSIARYKTSTEEDDEVASEANFRKKTAQDIQARIMNQFAKAQQQFLEHNKGMYDDMDVDDTDKDQQVKKKQRLWENPSGPCIVCQEELEQGSWYGMVGFFQLSNTIRYTPMDDEGIIRDLFHHIDSLDKPLSNDIAGNGERFQDNPFKSYREGIHASSCGHLMHQHCFENYISSQAGSDIQASRKEYLCPLCKSLGNILIPITLFDEQSFESYQFDQEFELWIKNSFVPTLLESLSIAQSNPSLSTDLPEEKQSTNQLELYESMIDALNSICSESSAERLKSLESHEMLIEALASTISCIEVSHRGGTSKNFNLLNESLLHRIDQPTWTVLRILSEAIPQVAKFPEGSFSTPSLPDIIDRLLIFQWDDGHDKLDLLAPVLYEDPFTLLVVMAVFVAPHHKMDLFNLVRVIYLLEVTRVTIATWEAVIIRDSNSFDDKYSQVDGASEETETPAEQQFFKHVLRLSGKSEAQIAAFFSIVGQPVLSTFIRISCLPLLRKTLILFQVCLGFVPSQLESNQEDDDHDEFERLCRVLRIPELTEACQMNKMISGWCKHIAVQCKNERSKIQLQFPGLYELVELPSTLDILVQESTVTTCPSCRKIPEHPALCLLCGRILCYQSSCCTVDQLGECYRHMSNCGKTVGIFMLINQSIIALLHGTSGCVLDAPYLDVHGEVDPGLTRGRPLFLNKRRYDELRRIWLSHTIPCYIARREEQFYEIAWWNIL